MVTQELGFCVLGNHDLNLLLGEEKHDNGWFFGDEFKYKEQLIPQALADDSDRAKTIDLFELTQMFRYNCCFGIQNGLED